MFYLLENSPVSEVVGEIVTSPCRCCPLYIDCKSRQGASECVDKLSKYFIENK